MTTGPDFTPWAWAIPSSKETSSPGNRSTGNGIGGIASGADGRIALKGIPSIENLTGGGIFLLNSFAIMDQNIVAGNLGGPGLRFSQQSSVFTASVFSRNAFFDNEKGPFFLNVSEGDHPRMENNAFEGSVMLELIQSHSDPAVSFQADNFEYDPKRARTTMTIPEAIFEPTRLAGRLFNLGDRWTVVVTNTSVSLTVHGNMMPTANPDSRADPVTALIPPRFPALDGLAIPLPEPPPLLDPPVPAKPAAATPPPEKSA